MSTLIPWFRYGLRELKRWLRRADRYIRPEVLEALRRERRLKKRRDKADEKS